MSATDRRTLSTRGFSEALRNVADLIDLDAFDGWKVLDERRYPEQGEAIRVYVTSEEFVRKYARRHPGAELQEVRRDDGTLGAVKALVGFGRGVDHDATHGPTAAYKYAVTFEVIYYVPEAV
jgi:hypothetical protein